MAGWTIYHDQWIHPTYFFGDISTRSTTTLHDTVDSTETFGLDSKYTTHRSRRCCCHFWPQESAAPSAQQSSFECWPPDMLQTPAEKTCRLPGVQCIYVWGVFDSYENTNIYIYMNIYDHIWRIYIYIYYMNMGYKVDVFIIRKTNIKNKKMHHKRWIFQGPWVWDAHHHPMKWGWLIYNHMVQHDTGI